MKVLRIILGLITGLLTIYVITESVEMILVGLSTDKSFEYLMNNADEYFKIRNATWILILKIFYTGLAAILGGFLTCIIAKGNARLTVILLGSFQVISIIWAGFISEMSETGPVWMWLYLAVILPTGIYIGYQISVKRKKVH